MVSQDSDVREHSKHLLESAAGEAQEQASEQRSVQKRRWISELHNRTSEYREHSQKLQSSEKATDEETSRKIVHRTLNRCACTPGHSENREHSQNLRGKNKPEWT